MDAMQWYTRTVGDASVNAVANKAGLVQTTLNRQVKAGVLAPDAVVAVARAYQADVLDALVACGLVTREDIRAHGVRAALRDALDLDLAAEIMRRVRESSSTVLNEPITYPTSRPPVIRGPSPSPWPPPPPPPVSPSCGTL